MYRVFAAFCVALLILAPGAASAAVTGDIKLSVDIAGLSGMMSEIMAQLGRQAPGDAGGAGDTGAAQQSASVSTTGTIIIQGDNLRISLNQLGPPPAAQEGGDAGVGGGASTMEIMLNNGDNRLYVYYPDTLNGFYVDLSKTEAGGLAETGALAGNRNFADALKGANVTAVGSQDVYGHKCTGYKVMLKKPETGKTTEVDLWVADDLGFPVAVRSKSDTFSLTWEITNTKSTPDKGVDYFRPPANAALREAQAAGLMSVAGM